MPRREEIPKLVQDSMLFTLLAKAKLKSWKGKVSCSSLETSPGGGFGGREQKPSPSEAGNTTNEEGSCTLVCLGSSGRFAAAIGASCGDSFGFAFGDPSIFVS